jgi:hypothetical protein
MAQRPTQPERPARPWWVMPLLVVLAILGVIYLVRLVLGFVFASVGLLAVVALLVVGFIWFTRSKT